MIVKIDRSFKKIQKGKKISHLGSLREMDRQFEGLMGRAFAVNS